MDELQENFAKTSDFEKLVIWHGYFEKYGCLSCGKKENYAGFGFCMECATTMAERFREA